MEWVETTGKTIEEATNLALDQLGVDADEAEVEVLDEPKSGLFGRVRSEARIRARVKPTQPRAKEERRRPATKAPRAAKSTTDAPAAWSEASGSSAAPAPAAAASAPTARRPRYDDVEPLDAVPAEVEAAGTTFLSGLVAAMGLQAEVEAGVVNANMVEFRIVGQDLGVLIGPRAQTLQAVQELLRTVVHYETNSSSGRILLDVGGYREKRRAALIAFTGKVAGEVVATGERRALEPMSAADRKVVHDCVQDIAGVQSVSEGDDPNRYVVLLPA